MTIEVYPSDQVADLWAEVTHWYENLQKEQINQQAQLQEFGQSSRKGDFPGELFLPGDFAFTTWMIVGFFFSPQISQLSKHYGLFSLALVLISTTLTSN